MLLRLVEIAAVLDELGAEAAHRRVLLDRIAVRHHDEDGKPGTAAGERERLAVIAAGRAHDADGVGPRTLEPVGIDEPAAHLEGAGRRVVLVLDHDLGAGERGELRPGVLRRRRHHRTHHRQGRLDLGDTEERFHHRPAIIVPPRDASCPRP